MKPCPVVIVLSATDNHWDCIRVASQAGHDFACPARTPAENRLGYVQVKRVSDLVGVKNIQMAVLIYVDETHPVVASVFSDDVNMLG